MFNADISKKSIDFSDFFKFDAILIHKSHIFDSLIHATRIARVGTMNCVDAL